MAEPIIPAGAFAAMKAGTPAPQPSAPAAPKAEAPPTEAKSPEPGPDSSEPPKNMTAAEKKIWKLKADGEEFEFDATNEDAVKREIMKARGASKRLESAAALRKQAETFFEMMKSPEQLVRMLEDPRVGIDVKQFAKDIVWKEMEESKLTDEQKDQRRKDQELKDLREKDAKRTEETERGEKARKQAEFEVGYEAKITKVLEAGGVPKTPASVARMAEKLLQSVERGLDLTPEELIADLRSDYMGEFGSILSAASGDQILALLGEANAEKLRQADLKRLRSTQGNPFPDRATPRPDIKAPQAKRLGASEWKEDIIKSFLSRK